MKYFNNPYKIDMDLNNSITKESKPRNTLDSHRQ